VFKYLDEKALISLIQSRMNQALLGENYTYLAFALYTLVITVVVGVIHVFSLIPLVVGYIILFFFLHKSSFLPATAGLEAFTLGSAPAVIFAICIEYTTMQSVFPQFPISAQSISVAILGSFLMAFVVAAMIEELCKFAMMKIAANHFNQQPFQIQHFKSIILYSGLGALGFSTMENVKYLMSADSAQGAAWLTFARVVFATTLHVCTGIYIGISGARSVLSQASRQIDAETRNEWQENWVHALLVPILVHGTYDFLSFLSGVLFAHADTHASIGDILLYSLPSLSVLFVVSPLFYRFVRNKYSRVTAEAQTLLANNDFEGGEEHQPLTSNLPSSPAPINML
jgi:RsiW-degrading membrane proteinase PrsW (M82 family)